MNRAQKSYEHLWLGMTLLVVLTLSFLLPLIPNDFWWYVRLGQDIMQDGSLPTVETYSFTQAGAPVIYQSWLSAAIFRVIYHIGQLPLTFLLRGIILALTYSALWRFSRQLGAGEKLTTIVVLLAVLSGSNNWSHRPQLLVYPLFVFAMILLWQWDQRTTNPKRIWWLVPVSLLWTNLHGSFPLLYLLMGAAFVFGQGDRKGLFFVLLAAFGVSLLNPYGGALWQSVAETFLATESRNLSIEWGPPLNDNWQMAIFFAWVLLMGLFAALSPRKLPRLGWVWYVGFGWLALSGMRYVIWFLFVAVLLSAYFLAEWSKRWLDKPSAGGLPAMNIALAALFVCLPFFMLPGVRERWWQDAPPALAANTPAQAIEWLNAQPKVDGHLWSDIVFSSYQIYALPQYPVVIDTRFQVAFTLQNFDDYFLVAEAQPGWEDWVQKNKIDLFLLSRNGQPVLIETLSQQAGWCLAYQDDRAQVFVRTGEEIPCDG